ncbi:MAG: hypothetical protein GX102_10100 [Porphyromonadaceae bacterium]|nr:hypothetical protein [Porphyromonadaceae bacterium]
MKTTYYLRFLALLALLIGISTATVYAQPKKAAKRLSKQEVFFKNVEKLKPSMSQADVRGIMGDPYKLSFDQNDD